MKTKYLTLLFLTFLFNLYSCQTIVDLKYKKGERTPNTYYKDIDNRLDTFEGTWIYDNGTDYIKIVLIKKIKVSVGDYFEDILIGEFQYKHNGIEKINTLHNLNATLVNIMLHGIYGNIFWTNHSPFDQYTTDNYRLRTSIDENDCISKMDIRTLILNGQSTIQIYKWKSMELNQACIPIIPDGFYYLMKQ